MRTLLLTLYVLLMAGAVLTADPPKHVDTVGELLAPKEKGQNFRLMVTVFSESDEGRTATHSYFALAFDDMHKDWPELKKSLPTWVGKQVIVTHREGHVEFGKQKVLLAKTAKLKLN
jgi:hypothetical protein